MSISHGDKQLITVLMAIEEEQRLLLIEDQHTAGLAPSNAVRPLAGHELAAQVRFADLENDRDSAVAEAEELLADVHAASRDTILTEMFGESTDELTTDQAIEVIHRLSTNQPEAVAEAETNMLLPLAGILAAAYLLSGRRVLEEAGRQGVPVADVAPVELPAEDFLPAARAVSTHPWRRISTKVEEEITRQDQLPEGLVRRDNVEQILGNIKTDGSVDQARQAVNQSTGRGRIDTIQETTVLEPDEIWASEIMDGRACSDCAEVDGKDYDSMEDAQADYPSGQYRNCAGGARCRGTLIFLFWET